MERRDFFKGAGLACLLGVSTQEVSAKAYRKLDKSAEGERMFRGIFFFQGDDGKALLRSGGFGTMTSNQQKDILNSANEPKNIKISDEIINELKESDKNVFSNLYDAIRSNDPYKVFNQVNILVDKIFNTKYIQNRLGDGGIERVYDNPTGKSAGNSPTCWVAAVVAAGVALVVAVVAVVNLAAGVNWALGVNVAAAANTAYAANYVRTRDKLSNSPVKYSEQYAFSQRTINAILKTMNVD